MWKSKHWVASPKSHFGVLCVSRETTPSFKDHHGQCPCSIARPAASVTFSPRGVLLSNPVMNKQHMRQNATSTSGIYQRKHNELVAKLCWLHNDQMVSFRFHKYQSDYVSVHNAPWHRNGFSIRTMATFIVSRTGSTMFSTTIIGCHWHSTKHYACRAVKCRLKTNGQHDASSSENGSTFRLTRLSIVAVFPGTHQNPKALETITDPEVPLMPIANAILMDVPPAGMQRAELQQGMGLVHEQLQGRHSLPLTQVR